MNFILKNFTRVWRDNGETDRVSLCRDGTRTQRSTVLRLFRVIKRCAFRETNEFLFLVPSPIIILGRILPYLWSSLGSITRATKNGNSTNRFGIHLHGAP